MLGGKALPVKPYLQKEGLTGYVRLVSEIHQRIKKARTEADLTQEQLAQAASTTWVNIRNWEARGIRPGIEFIPPLAAALRVSVAWLLTGEEQPYDDQTLLTIYAVIEPAERIARRYLAKKRLPRTEILELREALDAAHVARQMLGMPASSELDAKLGHRLAQLRAEREALREIAEAEVLDPLEEGEAPRDDGEDDPDAPQDGQPPEQAAE